MTHVCFWHDRLSDETKHPIMHILKPSGIKWWELNPKLWQLYGYWLTKTRTRADLGGGGGISYLDCIYTVCNKNHEQDDASLYNFLYNLWIISSKPFPAAVILLSLSPVQILNPWHVEHQMVKYSMSVLISYFSTYYWQ